MNGLLVVGGRLKHAPLSTAERHPSILPPRHALSRLILHKAHGRAHLGTEWVLSCVRQKHWIPGARNTLRSIRRQCVVCQACLVSHVSKRWLISQLKGVHQGL